MHMQYENARSWREPHPDNPSVPIHKCLPPILYHYQVSTCPTLPHVCACVCVLRAYACTRGAQMVEAIRASG